MKDQPLVTVYIPTYNRIELLKRAVESVRTQSYQNLEIIVVDDCSQDDTAVYLQKIATLDPRISYYLKEKNSGACASRNIAINMANGEYITGLDDDDLFLPERISKFIEYSKKYNMNNVILFSQYSHNLEKKPLFLKKIHNILSKKVITQKSLLFTNYIGNQVFLKTAVLRSINGFDESFPMWQDLDCWYRLLKHRSACLVPARTYIIDTSHGYDRITNPDKLKETFRLFVNKNKLTYIEKQYMRSHFRYYGIQVINPNLFLKRAWYNRDIKGIFLYLKYLFKK